VRSRSLRAAHGGQHHPIWNPSPLSRGQSEGGPRPAASNNEDRSADPSRRGGGDAASRSVTDAADSRWQSVNGGIAHVHVQDSSRSTGSAFGDWVYSLLRPCLLCLGLVQEPGGGGSSGLAVTQSMMWNDPTLNPSTVRGSRGLLSRASDRIRGMVAMSNAPLLISSAPTDGPRAKHVPSMFFDCGYYEVSHTFTPQKRPFSLSLSLSFPPPHDKIAHDPPDHAPPSIAVGDVLLGSQALAE
jgi:hypothetical protein